MNSGMNLYSFRRYKGALTGNDVKLKLKLFHRSNVRQENAYFPCCGVDSQWAGTSSDEPYFGKVSWI